jgi:carboxymethylenebutenolidase
MTKRIEFKSADGHVLHGEIGEPSGGGKAPAIVVIQEWHGINEAMKTLVDRFAGEGFLALAPDLYHGTVCTNDQEAAASMNALDKPKAVHEIGDAALWLRGHARSSGKVGVAGFCLGGGLTFAAVANVQGIDAAVPFYGLPGIPEDKFKNTKTPILAHFAKHDEWATASGAEAIQKAVKSGGGSMELHVYDAKHAFMRPNGPNYDEAASKVAWQRTIDFLRKHLG